MRTIALLAMMGLIAAAETPKPAPVSAQAETSKLTGSEVYALQTIADKIAGLQKALDEAKQFQQTLFREDCQSRKIDLAACEIRPDMTIAAKEAPKK